MKKFKNFITEYSTRDMDYIRQAASNTRMIRIDPKEYPPIRGMEGPTYFHANDIVLYYDRREGRYYDPKSDMYTNIDFDPAQKASSWLNPMFEEIQEGFSKDQIANLRKEFGKIDRVDPTSPTMQKLTKLIKGMSDEDLEEIKKAKIPFVSGIALSEIVMRRFRK